MILGFHYLGYFAHKRGPQNWYTKQSHLQGYSVPFVGLLNIQENYYYNHHTFYRTVSLRLENGQVDI
jgi:hypothetical protein